MKYSGLLLAGAGAALAQQACISQGLAIPSCGANVLLSLASSYGCGMTDFACQCSHQSEIQASATSPIIAACGVNTALIVQSSALALCSCAAANPGGSGGGSGSAPATSAMATATGGSGAGSSAAGGSSAPMQTSAAGGAGGAGATTAMFTGAAATAGSFVPVGGALGLLAGLVAYL